VVTVEGVERGRPIERETVHVLDNVKCRFAPHVVAASVGQWLLLANSDPILHNADAVDLEEHRTLFNVALSPDKRVRQPLARPGKIRITCDVRHTWMSAFVVVADHPYIAATDLEGAYEIRDVPPGRYRLRVWHERLGTLERELAVEKGDHRVEDFAFGPGS
jgi:plastocyanin